MTQYDAKTVSQVAGKPATGSDKTTSSSMNQSETASNWKTPLIIIASLSVLGAAGVGIYLFLKNRP